MADKKRVLILCTGNSARSQMAEGLLRHDSGDRFTAESAGTKPSMVRPEAITVMKEAGIDITSHRSKHVDECCQCPEWVRAPPGSPNRHLRNWSRSPEVCSPDNHTPLGCHKPALLVGALH